MGWWGFTFPLGVYSLSTMLIGEELPSLFFRVLGTVFGVSVILLWIMLAIRTAMGAWSGHLFAAPCLANLKSEDRYPSDEDSEPENKVHATDSSDAHGVVRRTPPDLEAGENSTRSER